MSDRRRPPDRAAQEARRKRRGLERIRRYDLSEASLELIKHTSRVAWFCHVGEPLEALDVRRETSLQVARRSVLRNSFMNILIRQQNAMTGRVAEYSEARFQTTWNEIVHQVNIRLQSTFDSAVDKGMKVLRLVEEERESMRGIVQIPVLGSVCEIEYADVFQADLHRRMFEWYKRGHFVCGFDGIWPDVKLVVY